MATVRNPFDEDDDVSITMLDPDEEPSSESDDNGANANADKNDRKTNRHNKAGKTRNAINPFTADDEDENDEDDDEDIPIVIPGSGDEKDSDTDNDNDSSRDEDRTGTNDDVIDNEDGNDEVTIVMPEENDNDSSVSVGEEGSPSSIKITSKFNRGQSAVNDNDSSVGKNEPDKSQHDDKTGIHQDSGTKNSDSAPSDSKQDERISNRLAFNPFVDSDEESVEVALPDEDKESFNDSVTADDETIANVEGSSELDHNDDVGNSETESNDSVASSESDNHDTSVGSSAEDVVDGSSSAEESSSKNGANDEESSDDSGNEDDVDVVMLEPESSVDEDAGSDDGSESEDDSRSDEETKEIDEARVNEAEDEVHDEPVEEVAHEDKVVADDGHVEDNHDVNDGDESGSVDEEEEDHSAVSEDSGTAPDDGSESDVDDSDEANDDHDNGRGSSVGRSVPSDENVPDSKVMDSGESVDSGPDSQSTDNDGVDSDTASGVDEPSDDHDSEDDTTDEDTVTDNDGNEDTVGPVDDEDKTSLSESDDGSESDSSDDGTVTVDDGDEESSSDDGEDLIQSWDDEDARSDESDDVDPHDEDASENGADEDEESDENDSQEEVAVSGEDGSGSDEEPVEDEDDGDEESSGQEPDGTQEEDVNNEDDTVSDDSDSDEDDEDNGLDDGSGDGDDGVVFPIGDEGDWVDEEPDEYDEVVEDEESDDKDDDDTIAEDDDESDSEDEEDVPAGEDDGGPHSDDDSGDDLVGLFHEPTDFSEGEDADDDGEPVDSDLEALFADRSSVEMLKGDHSGKSGRTQSKSRTSGGSRKPKTGDRNKARGHHDSPDDGSGDDVDHHRGGDSTGSGPARKRHDQERGPGRIDLAEVVGEGDDVADEATLRFDEESAAGRWGSHGLATGTAIGRAVRSLHSQGRIHNHKAIEDPEKARALTVREWQMGHGVRFTTRDVAALDYLTRWSYATTAQVARAGGWRDRKESRLMRRFETWEDMGWAHADREFAGPVLWTPTNAGSAFGPHAWLGGVNYHRVNPVSQSHSLGLSSLASWLLSGWGDDVLHLGDDWPVLKSELADGRAYLVSEREVRSGYIRIRSEGRGLVPIAYRCAMLGGADPRGRDPQPSRFKAFSRDYASGKAGLEDSPEYLACDPEELGREQWLWVVWGDWIWNRDPATKEQSYVPVEDRYDVNTNRPIVDRTRGDVFALLDHVPDMVIARLRNEDGSSRSLAIELELKDKGVLAYERTMASYGSRLGRLLYDKVLWVVPNSTVALSLYRAANNVGMVRGEDYEIIPFYTVERRNSYWTGADIVPAVWGRNNRVIPTIDPNSFLLS